MTPVAPSTTSLALDELSGRRVLVTGAASGIGLAVAGRFAALGATVGLNFLPGDARGPHAVAALREAGGNVHAVPGDVTDEDELEAAIADFGEAHGDPEIAIANAGIAEHELFLDSSLALWERTLAVNLLGVRNTAYATLPAMLDAGFGRLIFTASELGLSGAPELTHYCATKGAIIALAKSLAREVGPGGVTVNCVAPGPTETDMLTAHPQEYNDDTRVSLPLQRWGDPEEVAWSYVFLAGAGAGWYTGQVLSPNGGAVM
jgi:3-oxoacyl-[acyl-carrier protein] reductase